MPEIEKSIAALNVILKETFDVNGIPTLWHGLAEVLPFDDNHDVPVLLPNNKDGVEAIFDDRYAITAYHRVLAYSYEDIEGYGDEVMKREVATCKMVVWADPYRCNVDRNRLRDLIAMTINQTVTPNITGITEVNIGATSLLINAKELFNQEYNGYQYCIRPADLFFAVNYQITTEFDQSCYTVCAEC